MEMPREIRELKQALDVDTQESLRWCQSVSYARMARRRRIMRKGKGPRLSVDAMQKFSGTLSTSQLRALAYRRMTQGDEYGCCVYVHAAIKRGRR